METIGILMMLLGIGLSLGLVVYFNLKADKIIENRRKIRPIIIGIITGIILWFVGSAITP